MKTDSQSTLERFIARVDAFCDANEMSEGDLGRNAVNNHRAMARIRDGVGSIKSIKRIEQFMDDYEPGDEAATSDAA